MLLYLILAGLGLHCCVQALSSFGEQRFLSICGMRASHWVALPPQGTGSGRVGSVVVALGLCSRGSWAQECRLSSCDTRASLLHSMWDLPGSGIKPMSPALAGGFLSIALPGKSHGLLASCSSGCLLSFCSGYLCFSAVHTT